jgi:hypothetical protein
MDSCTSSVSNELLMTEPTPPNKKNYQILLFMHEVLQKPNSYNLDSNFHTADISTARSGYRAS